MGSDSAERCLMWFTVSSVGKKTVCLAPVDVCHLHRGLICIFVRCAGMLLLLLAALYFPHKTQSFKGFSTFFMLPLLLLILCVLHFVSLPPFHFAGLYLYLSVSFLSLLSTWPLLLTPVFVGFDLQRSMENLGAVGKIICCQQSL